MSDLQVTILFAFVLVIIGLIIGGWAVLKIARHFRIRSIKKRLNRGVQKEKEAAQWLKKNGYKILDYQATLKYSLLANKEEFSIAVTPDFMVEKNGTKAIVEVKSGEVAPKIENKATRRQLLEYHFIKPDLPLYLLDMELKELRLIEFGQNRKTAQPSNWKFWVGLFLGAALVAVLWYFLKAR